MALRDLKTRGEDYERRRREKDFFACRVLRERKAQLGGNFFARTSQCFSFPQVYKRSGLGFFRAREE